MHVNIQEALVEYVSLLFERNYHQLSKLIFNAVDSAASSGNARSW